MAGESLVARMYAELRADDSPLRRSLAAMPAKVAAPMTAVAAVMTRLIGSGISAGFTGAGKFARGASSQIASAAAPAASLVAGTFMKAGLAIGAGVTAGLAAAGGSLAAFAGSQMRDFKLDRVLAAGGHAAGMTAEEIKKLAGEIASVSTFSKAAATDAGAMLAKYNNVKGEEFTRGLKLAANLAAGTGAKIEDMADAVGKILSSPEGSLDALKDYGVYLTNAQRYAIEAKMASRDFAGAQRLVLDAMEKGAGTAASDRVNTLTGSFERLGSTLYDNVVGAFARLSASAGPALTRIVNLVSDMVSEVFGLEGANSLIDGIADGFGGAMEAVAEFLEGNRSEFIGWAELLLRVGSNLWEGVRDAARFAFDAVNGFADMAGTTVGGVWKSVRAGVRSAFEAVQTYTADMSLTWQLMWAKTRELGQTFWDWFKDAAKGGVAALQAMWDSAGAGGPTFAEALAARAAAMKIGDSAEAKKIRDEIAALEQEMDAAAAKRRQAYDREIERRVTKKNAAGDRPTDVAKGTPYVQTKAFQFQYSGLDQMYKSIQQAIMPSAEQKAAQDMAKGVQQGVKEQQRANGKLDKVIENTGKGVVPAYGM